MDDVVTNTQVLSSERGVWSATPWNYSSLRFLRFLADRSGELVYGYGKTIYAVIKCRWESPSSDVLRLIYLESPAYQLFPGFKPENDTQVKELNYRLKEAEVSGVEDTVARPYRFLWTLELSDSPWPSSLKLPYEIPRVFYGHRQEVAKGS